jgi:hypothetical protein
VIGRATSSIPAFAKFRIFDATVTAEPWRALNRLTARAGQT